MKISQKLKTVLIGITVFTVTAIISFFSLRIILPQRNLFTPTPNSNTQNDTLQNDLIKEADMKEYSTYAYSVLDDYFKNPDSANSTESQNLKSSDAELKEIKSYNEIFVTVLVDNKIRCCQSGSTNSNDPKRTQLDIKQAVERCIEDDRFGGVLTNDEIENAELVFNILYNKKAVTPHDSIAHIKDQIELGIQGFQISQENQSAYFKESVPISKNYDLEHSLQRLCSKAGLEYDCYLKPQTAVSSFDSFAFTANRNGDIQKLYRYDIYLSKEEIDNQLIKDRLALTQDWLLNNVNNETNQFEYMYYPSTKTYSTDNNHVRQLANIWSSLQLQKFLDNNSLQKPIDTSLSYYVNNHLNCKEDSCYVEIDGTAKLGYTAFAILALTESPSFPKSQELAEKLARAITEYQKDNGAYITYFNAGGESGIKYYPGEAMLALMKLYEQNGNQQLLNSVESAYPYYADYWFNNKNSAMVPWHTSAYYLLYQNTKDDQLKSQIPETIFEMNNWLIDTRQKFESPYKDEIGGFGYSNPSGVSTAVYLEGINDAYKIAEALDDSKHQKKYEESIRLGSRFVLQTQYTTKNTFYIEEAEKAVGGFRKSLVNNEQRIDYQQHAAAALMKTYENDIF